MQGCCCCERFFAGLAECFRLYHRDARSNTRWRSCWGSASTDSVWGTSDPIMISCAPIRPVNKADVGRAAAAGLRSGEGAGGQVYARLELTRSMSRSGTRRSRWTRTGSTAGWWMPSWRPTTRRPRRSCWIWMRPTTRSMAQEGRFFHGYYRHYCNIFSGEHLCARLRCSNIDGPAGSVEELERIVGRIRQSWPEVSNPGRLGLLPGGSAGVKTITITPTMSSSRAPKR